MEDRIQFDINDSLKYYLSDPVSIPTPDAHPELLDCETDPESLSPALIDNVLNPIVDAVAESPEGLTKASVFDSLQLLLKCAQLSSRIPNGGLSSLGLDTDIWNPCRFPSFLPSKSLSKVLDLIVSGLSVEADLIHGDLESDEQDAIQHHKQLLEMYGFLLQWALSAVEVKAAEKPAESAPARRGGPKSKKSAKDGQWDWTPQIQFSMETMCKVMKLKLGRVFLTTSDRDTFITLFTRTIYLILESEQRVKSMAIRMHAFKVLCIAVKHHGHAFGMCRASLPVIVVPKADPCDRCTNLYCTKPDIF
jgi:condensin complex subunit 1